LSPIDAVSVINYELIYDEDRLTGALLMLEKIDSLRRDLREAAALMRKHFREHLPAKSTSWMSDPLLSNYWFRGGRGGVLVCRKARRKH
jgi:hypothetical protein